MLRRAARTVWSALVEGVVGPLLLGVLAPLAGLVLSTGTRGSEFQLPWVMPPPAGYLLAGALTVLAFALTLTPFAAARRAELAGVCACGAMLAMPLALVTCLALALLTVLGGLGWTGFPVFLLLALLPTAPCILYARRAVVLLRAWPYAQRRARARAVGLSFLAPLLLGGALQLGLHRLERGVIERHVLAEPPADPTGLEPLRALSPVHGWPKLYSLTEFARTSDGSPPSEEVRRARAVYAALTDFELGFGD